MPTQTIAQVESWGGQRANAGWVDEPSNRSEAFKPLAPSMLRANGRSYGDLVLPHDRAGVVSTLRLDKWIDFNSDTGELTVESGVLLSDILPVIIPRGWMLPVVPGTARATVGGCLANDVHGKNHWSAGSFGSCVIEFELCRRGGERVRVDERGAPELFAATIGGLGATGLVSWVKMQLRAIVSGAMQGSQERFDSIDSFFLIDAKQRLKDEYTVAWIDAHDPEGRGVYFSANHAGNPNLNNGARSARARAAPKIPFGLITPLTSKAFASAYWHAHGSDNDVLSPWGSFFFPLDGVGQWNRMYGPKGFSQYQCVIPPDAAQACVKSLLRLARESGKVSFLNVLKSFGRIEAKGCLSFARPGVSLAMDFIGSPTDNAELFERLDRLTFNAGGALYPAKDGRMTAEGFRASFDASRIEAWRAQWDDALLGSAFINRVMGL